MSERAAQKCAGKHRHSSERRAQAEAKRMQRTTGCRMRAYPCEFCRSWHVGNLYSANSHIARLDAARAQEAGEMTTEHNQPAPGCGQQEQPHA